MSVRIGVIGAGIMGADHALILHRDVPGCEVVTLADIDTARAQTIAAGIPGANVTESALELIASDDIDAVLIASSDATHAEYVHACLDARKPVLCEKPLAPTSLECREIIAHEQEAIDDGIPLISVGFMRRFDPGYVELRAGIETGGIGTPLVVHSIGRGVSAPSGIDELTVTGSAIHDIDIAPWLVQSEVVEVSWVRPRQSPAVSDRQDPQFIVMRTADGMLVTVDVFLNATYGYDIRCEVVGSAGTASLAEPNHVTTHTALAHRRAYAADWRPRFAEAYRLQDRAWVEALQSGTATPLATARDGLRAALVADAVIASMHDGGAWVQVQAS